ncbi:hypothetical protein K1719_005781 [Acacia pycnantha]|nr:hypothetical protein K1719_005781 [Acacia pycnantha]
MPLGCVRQVSAILDLQSHLYIETNNLFDKIKPDETIWYIDDDQLIVNLKKHDPNLKWPDITESWESLAAGSTQLLKGTSIYLVGDSTDINQKVARELATGLGVEYSRRHPNSIITEGNTLAASQI